MYQDNLLLTPNIYFYYFNKTQFDLTSVGYKLNNTVRRLNL